MANEVVHEGNPEIRMISTYDDDGRVIETLPILVRKRTTVSESTDGNDEGKRVVVTPKNGIITTRTNE